MGILTYDHENFLMDGKPYRLISGAMHYFRIVPEYWEDRLKKLRACGFNTVETYCCWNLHERKPGQFDFSGILDVEKYIKTAAEVGLNVILRPGPYICAEWELGGLPSWLLREPDLALRCNNPAYLEKVEPYYRELFKRIRPHLSTNGGNVIMVQVENEYGSYGNDKDYLRKVVALYRENGIDCQLFTSDGTKDFMLSGGTLPELLAVANFGSDPKTRLGLLKTFKPDQPVMCGEYWCGWFDHWYEKHHTRSAQEVVGEVQDFFDLNGSFNFYMFHGGTNFGFWNGANEGDGVYAEEYQPTITSYDYCAPLSECGDLTETYYELQKILQKNTGEPCSDLQVSNLPKAAYGTLELTQCAPLFENLENLATPVFNPYPQCMEQLGQDFGYLVYSAQLKGPFEEDDLIFGNLHDRAHVFLNGRLLGLRERSRRTDKIRIGLKQGESARLDILVENMGRVNYGHKLFDRKGILEGIRIGRRFHFGWNHYSLPMEDLSRLEWQKAEAGAVPAFYKGILKIEGTPADTFLRAENFEKGIVLVNGFNVGRYYNSAGPQKTLYIPAPLLKEGENEIILFETDLCKTPAVTFEATPDLGKTLDYRRG